jgi:glycosyltransferase involved in cell wall biosynthesis
LADYLDEQSLNAAAAGSEERAAETAAAGPRLRTAVAVLITHFPRIDETFILREINELERNGQPVVVVPLVRDHPNVVHEEAKPWMHRARFSPLFSRSILRSNLRALVAMPGRYLRTLLTIIRKTMWRPSTLLRSVALFPRSVHLANELTTLGIRHVHAHFASHATTMAWIMASLSDLTYSFTVHGPDVFVHRLLLAEKIEKAAFVRCTSTFSKAFLSGLYPRRTHGRVEVVRTGVNPEVYAEAVRPRTKKAIQLLSVAALTPSRGFPMLIDALAQLVRDGVDVECRIVGDGRLRNAANQWIARHGLKDRVRLLGNLPQHEVARLMGEADIFVLPSIIAKDGQMDGIPVSLMEAMAAGKPVVGSAISGIPELVRDEVSGILVDAAYATRIAAAVKRLAEDASLRERFGRAGRAFVEEHYDLRRNAQALVALFDRAAVANLPSAATAETIRSLNWRRMNATAIGVRRIHQLEEEIVAEVTIGDGKTKQEVVVRQHLGSRRAQNEFEAISALPEALAPRLLMFDEPNAAIVVERADGKSLAGILRDGRRGEIAAAARKTGAWLRALQERTRGDEDGRHVVTGVALLALADADLAAAGDRTLRQLRAAVRERLQDLETRIAARALRPCGHHGRFTPENIFIGRRVEAVDFADYREGLPLEDVAELFVQLEMYGFLQIAKHSFLDGYGGAIDPDELRFCMLARALQRMARSGVTQRERAQLRQIIQRSVA